MNEMTFIERLQGELYPYRHFRPSFSWQREDGRIAIVIEYSVDVDARSWFKCYLGGVWTHIDEVSDEVIEGIVAEFDQHLFDKGLKED